jgi:cell division protein FtsI (penicillin-binding protein 3)
VAPQLVEGTRDASGRFRKAPAPASVRVVSPETARSVRTMLEGVVSAEGTAPEAKIEGYRVAGKTGTAQRVDPECSCYQGYTGSFIGMAPADDPELIVAVTLQRPTNGYYGGVVAAPVFRDVMTYALQKLQIPPTGTTSPKVSITTGDG